VRKPQVFLFDEPLFQPRCKLRVAMRTEIKALHQRLRTTSVYVTHDQIEGDDGWPTNRGDEPTGGSKQIAAARTLRQTR